MSQPKEYYYSDIKKWIMMYNRLPDDRDQIKIFKDAMAEALDQTSRMSNGDLRIKAINEILIDQTKTYQGVALELHYDWRTIQNWITAFVNLVGQLAGF